MRLVFPISWSNDWDQPYGEVSLSECFGYGRLGIIDEGGGMAMAELKVGELEDRVRE